MPDFLTDDSEAAVPLMALRKRDLGSWLAGEAPEVRRWVAAVGFEAAAGSVCLMAGADGSLARVLAGLGEDGGLWEWSALPERLPPGIYRLASPLEPQAADRAALGWTLGTYVFSRYRKNESRFATLAWPTGCDRAEVARTAEATLLVRDLINTPASDLGPEELARAVLEVGERHGAQCRVIVGDDLLEENFPAIHAVGRASARAPRLVDLRWGDARAPKLTLVGKGVCFDSGGLDLKTSSAMKLMKKDMGGAAAVLGLAAMIMAAGLAVRLRVLIPAVENSVSGSSLRPLDVVPTRKGVTVEIGNTDAEGRVILADALAEAASEEPALIVDCATLTGAARTALGTEVPALFCNDDALAAALLRSADETDDPLWRLPLWKPYRKQIESRTADLTNAPEGAYGGAITAALFLAEFVGPAIPWAHLDMMAWNLSGRPGRPEGGEAQGIRALFALFRERWG